MTRPTTAAGIGAAALAIAIAGCSSQAQQTAATTATTTTQAAPTTTTNPAADPTAPMDAAEDAGVPDCKDGQTCQIGTLDLTVKWGEYDPRAEERAYPGMTGGRPCTWITLTAHNRGPGDFLTEDSAGMTSATPWITMTMTAGDQLTDAEAVVSEIAGKHEGPTEQWPRRIREGKTATWRQCFAANEREQHLEITANGGGETTPLARWSRT